MSATFETGMSVRRRLLTAPIAGALAAVLFAAASLTANLVANVDASTADPQSGKPPAGKPSAGKPSPVYYPPPHEWKREAPAAVGMDAAKLDQAIAYAVANENPGPKDMVAAHYIDFGREPFDAIVGPTRTRGALNGLIIRRGAVVAEWGETTRVDMTHSVTKTFLSTVVGLAWDQGLIADLNDRVAGYMPPPTIDLFESPHNAAITWDHLLRQTSDWRGTLWDKPDWGDRPEGKTPADWQHVPLREPGTVYEYNDVRVNLLALAALHVWRRPLPQVLRERIMEPIGASSTWRWHGYENSWIDLAASVCSPSAAADTGAAACSSARATWRASATCSSATARGAIRSSCRRASSRSRARRARTSPTAS